MWDGECVELFLGGLFPMCHETSMVLRCMAEELCQRAQNMWFCFIPLLLEKSPCLKETGISWRNMRLHAVGDPTKQPYHSKL